MGDGFTYVRRLCMTDFQLPANWSIVLPAYNEEEVIGETVRVLRERYPDAEVLVVNDGSRDRTEEVARDAGARRKPPAQPR